MQPVRKAQGKSARSSKVRVIARLRPESPEYSAKSNRHSAGDMPPRCVRAVDSKSLEVWNWRNGSSIQYQFDGFFNDQSTQEEIYRFSISPVMQYVLLGENTSVFAYGPTGAGKTHTMLGTADEPGVIPRSVCNIFKAIQTEKAKSPSWNFEITFSYLEIYQEKVNDLLNTKKQDLPIRQDREGSIFIPELSEISIKSFEDFDAVFKDASQNRTTAATKLNPHSSRSHSILLIKVVRGQQVAPFRKLTGKMYLVDLAGSEDNRRTGNEGIRLKESGAINGSLFALGQVVDALNTGQPRVPYRNSKLTRLLQDSLGGSAHTCVIANIAPEPDLYYDTLNTLKFASKSRTIINQPFIKETFDMRTAFKRPRSQDEPDEKPLKSAKLPKSEVLDKELVLPSGLLSPLRAKQDSLEERMAALERRLVIKNEGFVPQIPKYSIKPGASQSKRKLLSQRFPLQALINSQNKFKQELISPTKKSQPGPVSSRDTVESVRMDENFQVKINPTLQAAYDAELLTVLNTGDVKELKKLQAIGEKRAQLIVQWRQLHGPLAKVQDLANVEGFTQKMATTFLKKNLLNKMVFT
ncbi:predicted protein [Nematostella vectensis]|uniref:Kinesin-like protein n=1 Tax=Nematostella vectensis TaxID=45351 RepID=A7SAG0_NEMVE|nr:predicted protein [Nematostella vectensis]|eukprot:XP_001631333.1 predicted protein [Nematostella vectensis]